jgi:hypothetical protein
MDTSREILRGFIKVHILFHASHEPVYGLGLIEELKGTAIWLVMKR